MTLQNGLIYNRRAYLWTDTAVWNTQGERIGTVSKTFTGIGWNWAATLSGLYLPDDPYRVQTLIAEAKPMDPAQLIEATRSALRSELLAGRPCRVLLAFPCTHYGARMFHIAADGMPGRAPLEPFETVQYMCSGNGSPWAMEYAERDLTPRDMREYIDRQITEPSDTVLGTRMKNAGGNLIETRVSAQGVKSVLVREIDPPIAEAA